MNAPLSPFTVCPPEERWPWDRLDVNAVEFPRDFLWGVAAAAHQVEGGNDNNNWSDWEQQRGPNGQPRIKGGQVAGLACDHWHRFREDIGLMRHLGVQAYRLSVEWSRLEPRPGEFNPEALAHYHAVLDALAEAGIQAWVTLHHFTHPRWFHALGSFEKEENIPRFVRFCTRVFREYAPKVHGWCTVNEPAVYSILGYGLGVFPPGKQDLGLLAAVQRHLILAHARVFQALKALPGGDRARIGLVHNTMQFHPWRRWHVLDQVAARAGHLAFNLAPLEYHRTGRYRLRIPGVVSLDRYDPEVAGSGDFVGLNYYSHNVVQAVADPREPLRFRFRDHEVPTDMPYAVYAEGFHQALHALSALGLPLYVTENGIADARDDRRALFIRRYLYALSRARQEGVDVRGYFYWSLMDNFEWAEGYAMKFGLYAMDPATRERRLRPGAQAFQDTVRRARGRG